MAVLSNILILIGCFIAGALVYFVPFFRVMKTKKLKDYFKENHFLLGMSILLIIGFASRTFLLDVLPGGLNQDEASAGYDAYAIMTSGMDRNGQVMPVHLIAWGSGQNALYSYLAIPFIAIFGNTAIGIRLPMGITGCITVYLIYHIFSEKEDKHWCIVATVFAIICPWHLMKSRWGLESNLFPDLVFYGTYFLIKSVKENKLWSFFVSAVIIGLSAYSYGTSYFFLFFYVIAAFIYLLITKKTKLWKAAAYIGTVGVLCIPIILFIYINVFDKESIRFLWMTIPKLTTNRFQTVTNIFSGTFFKDGFTNLWNALKLLGTQNDGALYNSTAFFGTTFVFSLPFTVFGLFKKYDAETRFIAWILRIWLIVCLAMMFIVSPNVNRINIVYIPIMLFTISGIYEIVKYAKEVKIIIYAMYVTSALAFSVYYCTGWNKNIKPKFYAGLGDAITYASSIDNVNHYYVARNVNMPYIYVLYYTGYDVHDFIDTVNYRNPGGAFRQVESFGNYSFGLPYTVTKGNVYIVDKSNTIYDSIDLSSYEVRYFDNFYVINTLNESN